MTSKIKPHVKNFIELLRGHAADWSDRRAYTFLANGSREAGRLTYGQLDRAARTIAQRLCQRNQPGDRVLLLLPPGLDFITSFMASIYARMIAVPAPPPEGASLKRTLPRLHAIAVDADASGVITTRGVLELINENRAGLQVFEKMHCLAVEDLEAEDVPWQPERVSEDTPALLQYTSGSTSTPKGVVITHANLVHNSEYINSSGLYTPDKITATWMPHVHDYGLIDGLLQPLYAGIPCYFMSPISFLKRPLCWLECISNYRVTHSHAPNFAFDYCVDRVPPEQRQGLDLSCWLAASNAAEPVRANTLRRFIEAYGPFGFREETFCPTYGLAEATVMVSTGRYGSKPVVRYFDAAALEQNLVLPVTEESPGALSLVGVGQPVGEMDLVIADPISLERLEEHRVGEIWLADPSVAKGYWNKPEETAENFNVYLADGSGGPFLRTGDLGFFFQNELYITGRLKDLMIIKGRNHYPQDIEETVKLAHEDLTANLAAFTLDRDGEERLVVVVEVGRKVQKRLQLAEVAAATSASVWEVHDLLLDTLLLLKPGSLMKTSSGKVQRRATKSLFLSGELEVIGSWTRPAADFGKRTPPGDEREAVLCGIWANVLGLEEVGIDDHFLELGGHSLLALRMASQVRSVFGIELPPTDVFSAPTVRKLAARLARLERQLDDVHRPKPANQPSGISKPLSFAQQRLWFLDRLEGIGPAYNLPTSIRLTGRLDIAALERALNRIQQRHDILRTYFLETDGVASQQVVDIVQVALPLHDLSQLPRNLVEQAVTRLADQHGARRFRLDRDALFVVDLLRLLEDDHVLLLNMHHIISDGWSHAILCQEISELYSADCLGRSGFLKPLPLQYADYAIWQREWLGDARLDRQVDFWRDRLKGAPAALDLPIKGPRPLQLSQRGCHHYFALDPDLPAALANLVRDTLSTHFQVLQMVFAELMGRYSGALDLCIGTPVANRGFLELEPLIGFFVNTLVLRQQRPPQSVRLRTELTRQTVLDALCHQDLPFERLVSLINPPRATGRSPLFQVMFVFRNKPEVDLELSNVHAQVEVREHPFSSFELTLVVSETATGFEACFEYSTDLFEASMIERMSGHFQNLLRACLAYPDDDITRLSLFSDMEQTALLTSLQGPDLPSAQGLCLHQLFERQVHQTSDAAAIIDGVAQISYAQLDTRAERLAAYLQRLGVRPGSRVAMAMPRNSSLLVAILGILKTGAAYVPLDPRYPLERLRFMLRDSGVSLLVGEADHLPAELLDGLPCELVSSENLPDGKFESVGLSTHYPAYVIYTSGSTGLPKGVLISHENAANLISWAQTLFCLEDLAGTLAATSVCFDLSIFEMFLPLASGGCIILAENALALRELPAAERVTLINSVPSALAELTAAGPLPPGVRVVNTAGEPLSAQLVNEIYRAAPQARVFDLYGPSEVTTYATYAARSIDGPVTIGAPVGNTRAYLLDGRQNPVPLEAIGEIYLAGEGVALGYLNNPSRSAEAFMPCPFGNAGERMYRTGDLASRLHDGNLLFLGRRDHQVKVRGFRIELGEIETALLAHVNIEEAVVLADGDQSARRLVGFLIASGDQPSVADLRAYLAVHLPDYMIPSAFVFRSSFPVLPNGKLDRPTLLAQASEDHYTPSQYVAPRTVVEQKLAAIWCDILGMTEISIYADFFELGGHSLLATRLISRVAKVFSVDLPLRALFQAPTIESFAIAIASSSAKRSALPTLTPMPRNGPLPLSLAQQRLWFLFCLEGGEPTYNMPAAIRLQGPLERVYLREAFNTLVARHESLRTRFIAQDDDGAQIIDPDGFLAFDFQDHSGQSVEVIQTLVEDHACLNFQLDKGPLFRVRLLRLGEEDHLLLVNMHHIISDGWSLKVLVQEVAELYNSCCRGETAVLPQLSVQYADYALWQRAWLTDEVLEEHLVYWRKQLEGMPASLDLPTKGPRPPVQRYQGRVHSFGLNAQTKAGLERLAHECQATLFQVLHCAFAEVLGRYAGTRDVIVGFPVANRRSAEVERLIGFFVNTLVLRTRCRASDSVLRRIKVVRDTALEAIAHQDLPFEKLVKDLNPVRDSSRTPLFQVMFTYQEDVTHAIELDHLQVSQWKTEQKIVKFDLMLAIAPSFDGLIGELEYNTDLFERAMIERMSQHLQNLLKVCLAYPNDDITRLSLLTEAEQSHLLNSFQGPVLAPARLCLHQLFERQAQQTPEASALIYGEQQVSYAQLDEQAERLAAHLQHLGVRPGSLVAMAMPRNTYLLVAMLGILKAGAAYVPLDPKYPIERLRFILRDSRVSLLVGDATNLPGELCHELSCEIVSPANLAEQRIDPVPLSPLYPAYVIYTSGSTGRPKGVLISHGNAANLIAWSQTQFLPEDLVATLAVTSVCFDLSIFELFLPLASGGCIILAENALALRDLPTADRVTLINSVPSALAELTATGPLPSAVRVVNTAGEPLTTQLVNQILRAAPQARVFDLYGPSEVTTYATFAARKIDGPATIGTPVGNIRAYLLDDRQNPVPHGVIGEIYLAGEGVALGYLYNPSRSAESFIPCPFGHLGERMYRTGDLASRLPDGNLLFLGRKDHQVKVRGFRIELGEIEAVMLRHDQVEEAVVLADGDQSARRLVGFLSSSGDQPTIAALRAYLAAHLPEYMIPAGFVFLKNMPLTPNGKLDRQALARQAKRALGTSAAIAEYVAARSSAEKALCTIFAEVLGLNREVGIDENFFELGGHSLLVSRLAAMIRKTCKLELSLREVFETPTVRQLAVRLEGFHDNTELPTDLVPGVRPEHIPLSFAQQRLWILDRLKDGGPVYNIPIAMRIKGFLDVGALEWALGRILERHEILRTRFCENQGHAQQLIDAYDGFSLDLIDLTSVPFQRVGALRDRHARHTFNLEKGPLFLALLMRLETNDHVLLLNQHHIISDGWSSDVLSSELSHFYKARCRNQEPNIAPLMLQYADFTCWQHAWLRGPLLENQLDYWLRELADAPRVLELPTKDPRPTQRSNRANVARIKVDTDLLLGLQQLTHESQGTLFLVLLTAFVELLGRYSNAYEVCVGTPVANRRYAELEPLLGFFVNTLVLRGKREGVSVLERIAGLRKTVIEALAHQDLPFEQLVAAINPQRDLSRAPLFQAMFVFRKETVQHLNLPAVTCTHWQQDDHLSKFDITFFLTEAEQGLVGHIEYNATLFEHELMARMAQHYALLLRAFVADPLADASRIPILTDAELRQILSGFNQTELAYPRGKCLHQLFEAQASATPERIAVIYGDQQVNYGALNAQADRVARYLRASGVNAQSMVAFAMPRSARMLVAILGILKAGAAYVPLDPKYPIERLRYMLRDSGSSLLISEMGTLPDLLTEDIDCCVRLLDQALEQTHPTQAYRVLSGQPAYVIYTSGSTGKPKGVLIHHGNAEAMLAWARTVFSSEDLAGTLAATSVCFDLSIFEIFLPLSSGGTVVMAENALELPNLPARDRVTLINSVPSALAELTAQGPLPASVRVVNTAGELLSASLVRRIHEAAPAARIFDLYGPSEVTTYATFTPRSPEGPVIIGRPVGNTRAFLLDSGHNPVPIGVNGEIFLAGESVARGYLNQPGRTAESFVPCPFGGVGERMYRTGDLARWRSDGNLVFLGRLDHQVKLRGYRIELGEIEAALRAHPSVADALVLTDGEQANRRLLCFVLKAQMDLSLGQLHAHLSVGLPDYMIPNAFYFVEVLPLLPNGKIDRKALLTLAHREGAISSEPYQASRNLIEEVLVAIWSGVLERPGLGIHANFFESGGHSLLATQVLSRVAEAFSIDLPLSTLFEAPTVALFSQRITASSADGKGLPDLIPVARDLPLPLSFAQQRLWYIEQLEADPSQYNIPCALRIQGPLDLNVLEGCFLAITKRHEAFSTRFQKVGKEVFQIIEKGLPLVVPVVDLSGLLDPVGTAQRLAETEARYPFNLNQLPLFHLIVYRLADGDHILELNMHHIITDGWSLDVLAREFTQLYQAAIRGTSCGLSELTLHYADFAAWQHHASYAAHLETQLDVWKARLANPPKAVTLTYDREVSTANQNGARLQSFQFDADVTLGLLSLANGAGASMFMVLHAALACLLSRYSGQRDIVIGAPIANRTHRQLEPLIGFFVNTLALRCVLCEELSFIDLLKQIRQISMEAHANQDVPFQRVLETVPLDGQGHRPPLFRVFLGFHAFDAKLDLPGLRIEEFPIHHATAKFDLTFVFLLRDQQLRGTLEYIDCYDQETIDGLLEDFQRLLSAIVANPEHGVFNLAGFIRSNHAEREVDLDQGSAVALEAEVAFVAPRNDLERKLAEILSVVLEVKDVGVYDNFFRLGGHSLAATYVLMEIFDAFDLEISLKDMFADPTVVGLAKIVGSHLGIESVSEAAPAPLNRLVGLARDGELWFPLSFGQNRLWFLDRLEPGSPFFNLPVSMRIRGELDVDVLRACINEVIRRHEILRTNFRQKGVVMQVISAPFELDIPLIDLDHHPEKELSRETERLINMSAQQSFDLEHGRLLSLSLIKLGKGDHILTGAFHHIIFDAWSMDVLSREVLVLYEAFLRGLPSPLPELSAQYADYAVWQRERLEGELLEREIAYWKKELAFAPLLLEIPLDFPRPPEQTFEGKMSFFELPDELARNLKLISAQAQTTLFMTLFSAFQLLMHWYSGKDDIVIGTDVTNRSQLETKDMIGFFVNQLALRSQRRERSTFLSHLELTRNITQQAYQNQNLPFDVLVSTLNPARGAYAPLFQVKFNIQHVPAQKSLISQLVFEPLSSERTTSQLDMIWAVREQEGKLSGSIEYNTGLFLETTIKRLSAHYLSLLEKMVAQPDLDYKGLVDALNHEAGELKKQMRKNLSKFSDKNFRKPKNRESGT